MKVIPLLSVILGSAVMRMASGIVFGAFALPDGVDPNQIRGELLAVRTVAVGQTDTICVMGDDPDGVEFIPVSLPAGMKLETQGGTAEIMTVEYSWKLDVNDVGIHYIVVGFADLHPVSPLLTEATIIVEVVPPPNSGPPIVRLCP
jgi:hypothetical protein